MSIHLTNDPIEQFKVDGFLVVHNLLDEKSIAQLNTRLDHLFRKISKPKSDRTR